MVPSLKGLHLTINGWQSDQDDEGWKVAWCKLTAKETASIMSIDEVQDHMSMKDNDLGQKVAEDDDKAPAIVKVAPCLKDDIMVMQKLVGYAHPIKRKV